MIQKRFEQNLLKSFERIDYWRERVDGDTLETAFDSLEKANSLFESKLRSYIKHDPTSIHKAFKALQEEGLVIITSEDGCFKIYNWDTMYSKTSVTFGHIFQYKLGKTVLCKPREWESKLDQNSYTTVGSLTCGKNTYYLVPYFCVYSTIHQAFGLLIFKIGDKGLNYNTGLIKIDGKRESFLEYDFNSLLRYKRQIEDPMISYDPIKKVLKIPLVLRSGRVSNRYINYKFNGQYFEKVKS